LTSRTSTSASIPEVYPDSRASRQGPDGDQAMDVFHHPYAYAASREPALVA